MPVVDYVEKIVFIHLLALRSKGHIRDELNRQRGIQSPNALSNIRDVGHVVPEIPVDD